MDESSTPPHCEAGQSLAEFVVVAPLLLLVVLVIVMIGRVESAQGDVISAARAAVQAAAVQSGPAQAQSSAMDAAYGTLAGAGFTCADPVVDVDTSEFHPGGVVSVTVTCTSRFDDLGLPGVGSTRTLSSTEAAPIDPYRTMS